MGLKITGVGRSKTHAPFGQIDPTPDAEEMVMGLSSLGMPIAFVISGSGMTIELAIGSWAGSDLDSEYVQDELTQEARVTLSLLQAQIPEIDVEPVDIEVLTGASVSAGLAIGVPSFKPPTAGDPQTQIDRLIRGMAGAAGELWQVMILAEPVRSDLVCDLRNRLIAEMRGTETAIVRAQTSGAFAASLEEHYLRLLMSELASLSHGVASGGWRTAVYLMGSPTAYRQLSSLWRGIFQGYQSEAVPIRVLDDPDVADLAAGWAMPDMEGADGGGYFRRPFEHQTLLNSTQLATYVQLPVLETAGYSVRLAAPFDVVSGAEARGDELEVGQIVQFGKTTDRPYRVPFDALTRHALVAGITGGGKTNTLFHLLKEAHRRGTPFLVLEPAKSEYRELLADSVVGDSLRVFTLGDERTAPLRLNPFEPEVGIPVSTHIDLLRSVFGVSLGMWTPLPQVVERAIHEIYEDRGWDIARDVNDRLDADGERHRSFPTITDLIAKVEEVVPQLGYGEEVEGNVLGALRTRLHSLRTGGRGRMLDTQWSFPIAELVEAPTVLEMDAVGDDDDKAFLIGLLMIRIAEHRRVAGQEPGLVHLLVIEEAHRLLANTQGRAAAETADPRGKAVETFANLLSEVRAYGQGLVIVDQVPTKLAPDVIKNTGLKIVHRIVSLEDRAVLAGSMAMNPAQAESLVTLPIGRAAVLSGYDDTPILVQVPLAKEGGLLTDDVVRSQRDPRVLGCRICSGSGDVCAWAALAVEDQDMQSAFARLVLSSFEDPTAASRLVDDLRAAVRASRHPMASEDELMAA
ncbi:MAG: ATP-binding protein, partial [Acidimicrobiia bacterium]|nr:ATP-binding protein [Acidimicrobiia bacterium]